MAKTAEHRWKGRTASQRAEQHAAWVLDEWVLRPRLGYQEMLDAVMKHFEVGHIAAEQAIKIAREILHERATDPALADKIAAAHFALFEDARALGDRHEARRNLESLRKMFGFDAPDKHHHSGAVLLDMEKLSDEELLEQAGFSKSVIQRSDARGPKPTNGHAKPGDN